MYNVHSFCTTQIDQTVKFAGGNKNIIEKKREEQIHVLVIKLIEIG